MPFINKSKITFPQNETNLNVWSDYLELSCLLNPDRSITVEDIKDKLIDESGGDEEKALAQISSTANKHSLTIDVDKFADDQIDSDYRDLDIEQRIKSHILNLFVFLKQRKKISPDYYPFIVSKQSISISTISDNNKIYLILLLSSLIRIINSLGGYAYKITHLFEELCEHPFRILTNQSADLYFTGSGGSIDQTKIKIITGSFYNKVEQIAKILNLETTKLFTVDNAGIYNHGDGGLDWLALVQLNDGLSTTPTFFAQCACGNDWEDKQFDASGDKWKNFITFINDYQKIHFIPKSFRNSFNKWENESQIYNSILIDRFRLIHLIDRSGKQNAIITLYKELLEEIQDINEI